MEKTKLELFTQNKNAKQTNKTACADLEVRHSNMEESVFYFIRRKHNLF